MLRWSLAFFIVSIVAAVLGFGGIAAGASDIARIFFYFFIIVFGFTLLAGLANRRSVRGPN